MRPSKCKIGDMRRINKHRLFSFLYEYYQKAVITKEAINNFIIQTVFAVLTFLLAMILARFLGPSEFGSYSNAIAWVNIFTNFSVFGFNGLLVRDIAAFYSRKDWGLFKGLLSFSGFFVFLTSVLLAIVLIVSANLFFSAAGKETIRYTLWIASPLIPLYSFANLRQSVMRGLQNTTRAMLPDLIIRPFLTLVMCIGLFYWLSYINPLVVVLITIIASSVALLVANSWLNRLLPPSIELSREEYKIKEWFMVAFPMFLIGGAQIIIVQSPVLMLGVLSTPADVGSYAVIFRISTLLTLLPLAVNIVMGPRIVHLSLLGDKNLLQNNLQRINRLTFGFTFFLGFLFVFAGRFILSVFGEDYVQAYQALIILVIGFVVDSGLGMSSLTLMMVGYERIVAITQIVFGLMLILLCVLMIPPLGYEGAALASTMVVILSRIVFAFIARIKTGINTTILSK